MGRIHHVLIKAGTRIVCLRGHVICKVAADIRVNDTLQPAMFAHWQVPSPSPANRSRRAIAALPPIVRRAPVFNYAPSTAGTKHFQGTAKECCMCLVPLIEPGAHSDRGNDRNPHGRRRGPWLRSPAAPATSFCMQAPSASPVGLALSNEAFLFPQRPISGAPGT
jgi:hypothetical protein